MWYLRHNVYGGLTSTAAPTWMSTAKRRVRFKFAHHMDDGTIFALLASFDPHECGEVLLRTPEKKMRLRICADVVAGLPAKPDSVKAYVTCIYNYWSNARTIVHCI